MSKNISVHLDDYAEESLKRIIQVNRCSISDAVVSAINALGMEEFPCMEFDKTPMEPIKLAIEESGMSVEEWCQSKVIDIKRLRYLVNRCAKGGTVWGLGNNKNKYRDKQDQRTFKTHTSWIAHCLMEDFGIDLI